VADSVAAAMYVSVEVFHGDFPTVSYRNCWPESVRWELTEAPKGSSYAKDCISLIALTVEIGSEKIPLSAPLPLAVPYTSLRINSGP
jgi:hypothetical protein